MSYIKFSTIFIILLTTISVANGQNKKTDPNQNNKAEAERIWELAIEAKGGREKLHAVRNIFISTSAETDFRGEKTKSQTEHLAIIPNKEWILDDNRPSIFGLRMTMYNWEEKNKYFMLLGDTNYNGLVPVEASEDALYKMPWIVNYLLETKWHRPIPEEFREGKIGSQKVNIIQTRLESERIDFAFDKKTYLPVKYMHYSTDSKSGKEQIKYEGYLTDYIDIDGIKMPGGQGKKISTKTSYQFNVEYDESIFETPPPFTAGREAWKKSD